MRGLRTLDCEDVPARALAVPDSEGRVDSLTVAFDAAGRVVAIDALRRRLMARRASDSMEAARERLTSKLGLPTDTLGSPDAEYLAGGPFRTAYVRYRFRDYVATVTVRDERSRPRLADERVRARDGGRTIGRGRPSTDRQS